MLLAFRVPLIILYISLAFGQVGIGFDFIESPAIRESQSISIFMHQRKIDTFLNHNELTLNCK